MIPPQDTTVKRWIAAFASRFSGLFGHLGQAPPRGARYDAFQAEIHEQLSAMGQFVLLDGLHHLEAREPLAVETRDLMRHKIGGLGSQFRQAAVERFPEGCG